MQPGIAASLTLALCGASSAQGASAAATDPAPVMSDPAWNGPANLPWRTLAPGPWPTVEDAQEAQEPKRWSSFLPFLKEEALAGEPITAKLTRAPGNDVPIDGLKVVAGAGWFAARPSGTENLYKIYAESLRDQAHLDVLVGEAQEIVNKALGAS